MRQKIDTGLRAQRVLRRRGMTAVLAMMFLVLIGALALGFYSQVATSSRLSNNDQKGARALVAAESGVRFMRYQLARIDLPPNTTTAQLLAELQIDLKAALERSGNLGGGTVGLTNDAISIPAEADATIGVDGPTQTGFTVRITLAGSTGVVCKITGYSGTGTVRSTKHVQLLFRRETYKGLVLNNAVATRGRLTMVKGVVGGVPGISSDSIANVASTYGASPAVAVSGGTIGGDIGVTGHDLTSISGGSVGGTKDLTAIEKDHVKIVTPPAFPYVDTTVFEPFATNKVNVNASVLKNVRIPANTNPRFNGDVAIQGIMYIESPNVVEFSGKAQMEGFIVFEPKGDSTVNQIIARGSVSYGDLPPGAQFDALRAITGISMLAPTASLSIGGNVDAQVRGNLILGSFDNSGSADMRIDKGSLVTMDRTANSLILNGKSVRFSETGMSNAPSAGIQYGSRFLPQDGTYAEKN
jgi:hypothetical protein